MLKTALPYPGRNRRKFRPSPALVALSGLAIAGIGFATLCPIGMRPHFASANQERFGAYAVLGFIIAMTIRRHVLATAAFVVLLAVALEAGQLLIPGRDARVMDATFKALGGLSGLVLAYAMFPLKRFAIRWLTPIVRRLHPAINARPLRSS